MPPTIRENILRIQDRIAQARQKSPYPTEVTLIAVSKTHSPESIREAYEAGLRHFGKNPPTKNPRCPRPDVHSAIPRRPRKSPPLFRPPPQTARRSRRLIRPAAPRPLHGHVPRLRSRHPGRSPRSPHWHRHLRHPPQAVT